MLETYLILIKDSILAKYLNEHSVPQSENRNHKAKIEKVRRKQHANSPFQILNKSKYSGRKTNQSTCNAC